MKTVRKMLQKKVKGDASYIATLVSITMLLILVVGLLYVFGEVVSRNEVERVHRKYLLAMERDGYLTDVGQNNLTMDLERLGCSNIVISGSLSPVGYGNTITLKIECDLEVRKMNFTATGAQGGRGLRHIVIEKSGTALY